MAPPPRSGHHEATRGTRLALAMVIVVVMSAVLAPWLAPHDPNRLLDPIALRSSMPSWSHPLGTDALSRDVFSRMLFGTRVSLSIAIGAVLIATGFGTAIGIGSGLLGGMADRFTTRVVEIALALPRVVILLVAASAWGTWSVRDLTIMLGLTGWMSLSRLVRTEVRSLRTADHVLAARALGVGTGRLVLSHVLPALRPLVAIAATMGVGQVLLLESGLAILGVGVPPSVPSWGGVLLEVSDVIGPARWLVLGPGLILMCCVAAVYRLGDALERHRRVSERILP